MAGGFFNKMYYGNPNKPDLKKEDVKTGRFKTFFTVLQIRFWQLIQLNLLYSVFWIPAFVLLQGQLLIMQETKEPISLLFYLLMIPCLMLIGPATASVSYILRNWARDEHSWVWSDFKDAWKENWKQGMFMGLIDGIALLLFGVNFVFYGQMAGKNLLYAFLYYFMIMIAILFTMMNMFVFPMMVTYRLKLKQIIKNSFILTMVKLPFAFLIFLLSAAIFIVTLAYLLSIPFFVAGLTFPGLIIVSYVNWVFDKYINPKVPDQEDTENDHAEITDTENGHAEIADADDTGRDHAEIENADKGHAEVENTGKNPPEDSSPERSNADSDHASREDGSSPVDSVPTEGEHA